jgi:hypothetical protein
MHDDFDPPPPSESALRMEAVRYAPDGGAPFLGTVVMFATVLLSGALTGIVASWARTFCCCTGCLVSPVMLSLFGLSGSLVGVAAVGWGKVRRPAVAGLTGVIGIAVTLLALVLTDYQRALDLPQMVNDPAARARIAAGNYDFEDYLEDMSPGELIMMGLCLVIAGSVSFYAMATAAAHPYCAGCERWKYERRLGSLDLQPSAAAVLLESGGVVGLTDRTMPLAMGPVELSLYVCPGCEDGGPVEVRLAIRTGGEKSKRRAVGVWTYPGTAKAVFLYLFRKRPV